MNQTAVREQLTKKIHWQGSQHNGMAGGIVIGVEAVPGWPTFTPSWMSPIYDGSRLFLRYDGSEEERQTKVSFDVDARSVNAASAATSPPASPADAATCPARCCTDGATFSV